MKLKILIMAVCLSASLFAEMAPPPASPSPTPSSKTMPAPQPAAPELTIVVCVLSPYLMWGPPNFEQQGAWAVAQGQLHRSWIKALALLYPTAKVSFGWCGSTQEEVESFVTSSTATEFHIVFTREFSWTSIRGVTSNEGVLRFDVGPVVTRGDDLELFPDSLIALVSSGFFNGGDAELSAHALIRSEIYTFIAERLRFYMNLTHQWKITSQLLKSLRPAKP